jgi:hypothetical protein
LRLAAFAWMISRKERSLEFCLATMVITPSALILGNSLHSHFFTSHIGNVLKELFEIKYNLLLHYSFKVVEEQADMSTVPEEGFRVQRERSQTHFRFRRVGQ